MNDIFAGIGLFLAIVFAVITVFAALAFFIGYLPPSSEQELYRDQNLLCESRKPGMAWDYKTVCYEIKELK